MYIYRTHYCSDLSSKNLNEEVIDSTGCGDTYTAIYCYARLKKYSIYHSGLLASAGSGMKTEKTGGLNSSFKMIKKRANSICQI